MQQHTRVHTPPFRSWAAQTSGPLSINTSNSARWGCGHPARLGGGAVEGTAQGAWLREAGLVRSTWEPLSKASPWANMEDHLASPPPSLTLSSPNGATGRTAPEGSLRGEEGLWLSRSREGGREPACPQRSLPRALELPSRHLQGAVLRATGPEPLDRYQVLLGLLSPHDTGVHGGLAGPLVWPLPLAHA